MTGVVVKIYRTEPEAELAKGLLDGSGIWSMTRKEIGALYIGGLEGVAVVVRPEDLEKAKEIILG